MKNNKDNIEQSRPTLNKSLLVALIVAPFTILLIKKLKLFQQQTYPPIVIKDGSFYIESNDSLDDSTGHHHPHRPHKRKHHRHQPINHVMVTTNSSNPHQPKL